MMTMMGLSTLTIAMITTPMSALIPTATPVMTVQPEPSTRPMMGLTSMVMVPVMMGTPMMTMTVL